ncbi:hypothetical protein [Prevotella pallens]|nr:hypothetical protein [Prevotella pallens]
MHSILYYKLFADKGYISKGLFEKLFNDGIHYCPRKSFNNLLKHL